MSIYEAIYSVSPIPLQSAILSVYGRKLTRQRYGSEYRTAFQHYTTKDYSNLGAELENQAAELRRLINHAACNSEFYSKLYSGIDWKAVSDPSFLSLLPIVEKEDLRRNIASVYTIGLNEGVTAFTGGTTGKSLRVVYTKADFQRRMAYLDAFKVRCGIDPFRARKATFSGRQFATGVFQRGRKIYWRDNWTYNQRLYSTFDLQDDHIPMYLDNLNAYKPDVLNGFVSALYQVAKFAEDHGYEITFTPRAIFTTSETLLPHHRELIERIFRAPVYNQYASAEGAPFVTECPARRLHYNIDTGVIELAEFTSGPEMVITSFTSYGTPLIRYRIGDTLQFGHGDCECGSSHPLVERIEGRAVDYLYSPERGRVSLSHLADVIKGLPNCIREMQFIQQSPESVTVRVSADPASYTEDAEAKIAAAMRYRFGKTMQIEFERVAEIPREASGKFSLIKNLLPRKQLAETSNSAPD